MEMNQQSIKRCPIKVYRTPIKLPQDVKMTMKIQEMMDITREDDIFGIIEHYEMLARRVQNKSGYNAVSLKNPKGHKNWIHFERVYEVCRMKEWDAKLYIEVQFTRAKSWKTKCPLPNMLYSKGAFIAFINHVAKMKQTYEKDVNKRDRQKSKETKTLRKEVIDAIVNSVEMLDMYIRMSKTPDKAQYKAMKIYQSWEELSYYYLWSIPWFHDIINDLPGERAKLYREKFVQISKSPSIKTIIEATIQQVEQSYNIPNNIQLG